MRGRIGNGGNVGEEPIPSYPEFVGTVYGEISRLRADVREGAELTNQVYAEQKVQGRLLARIAAKLGVDGESFRSRLDLLEDEHTETRRLALEARSLQRRRLVRLVKVGGAIAVALGSVAAALHELAR